MNTLLSELPLSGKVLSSASLNNHKFLSGSRKTVKTKTAKQEFDNQNEFIEIDPFTGQIRTIRR